MKKIILLFLVAAFSTAQASAETQEANLKGMGMGLCVARQLIPAPATAPGGELSLVIPPEEEAIFAKTYTGIRLLLCNRTDQAMPLRVCEGILPLIQEAQDEKGVWKPIEVRAASSCGNSYFTKRLPPGQAWQLTAPKYAGTVKTKLRFKLLTEPPVYSKEFDGTVNPGQFTPTEAPDLPEDFYRALQR